jgi:predicted DNA-binding antitoxin AbrB/MazE fold protein
MKSIHAVYENGVFRPVEAVDLPDRCYVEFEPRIVDAPSISPEPGRGVCGPA